MSQLWAQVHVHIIFIQKVHDTSKQNGHPPLLPQSACPAQNGCRLKRLHTMQFIAANPDAVQLYMKLRENVDILLCLLSGSCCCHCASSSRYAKLTCKRLK